jgi:hypothetical protein
VLWSTAPVDDESDRPDMTRFAWDFYGPSARAVAEHFVVQLTRRVADEHAQLLSWGSWAVASDHVVVWLDSAPEAVGWVERTLAPPRVIGA